MTKGPSSTDRIEALAQKYGVSTKSAAQVMGGCKPKTGPRYSVEELARRREESKKKYEQNRKNKIIENAIRDRLQIITSLCYGVVNACDEKTKGIEDEYVKEAVVAKVINDYSKAKAQDETVVLKRLPEYYIRNKEDSATELPSQPRDEAIALMDELDSLLSL